MDAQPTKKHEHGQMDTKPKHRETDAQPHRKQYAAV